MLSYPCPFCGQGSTFPSGPHLTSHGCPVLKREHEQRMHHAEVKHRARLAKLEGTPPVSEETAKLLIEALAQMPCPHCGAMGIGMRNPRWHLSSCPHYAGPR